MAPEFLERTAKNPVDFLPDILAQAEKDRKSRSNAILKYLLLMKLKKLNILLVTSKWNNVHLHLFVDIYELSVGTSHELFTIVKTLLDATICKERKLDDSDLEQQCFPEKITDVVLTQQKTSLP